MEKSDQQGGYEAELKEADRAETQERTTAYGHRRKDEIGTIDDLKLWRKRKRKMEREKDEC